MCLTISVTILDSKTAIKYVLYYQSTVGAAVWRAKASMYLQISLVFLTAFYIHLIYLSVESKATSGCIYNFQHTERHEEYE